MNVNLDLPRLGHPALCAQVDPEMFFAESQGISPKPARAICGRCEAKTECLEQALTMKVYGVWGGLTARERIAIQQQRGITPRTLSTIDADIDNPTTRIECEHCGHYCKPNGLVQHQRTCQKAA